MDLQLHASPFTQEGSYHDDSVEIARLANKTHLLLQALGGPLPGLCPSHLKHIGRVLEIACGPGGWARELARSHPQLCVIGADTSSNMINYARRILQIERLTNVAYLQIPSMPGPFPFEEASFDLITVQFASKFLTAERWSHFLSACWHLLSPGGLLRLTEFGIAQTNAPAHAKLNQLFVQAMQLTGQNLSPSGTHPGLLYELETLLSANNFRPYTSIAHLVNYSSGALLHEGWKKDMIILSRNVYPFIVQSGVASQDVINTLHQQQHYEINLPTFQATLPLLTLWGKKND